MPRLSGVIPTPLANIPWQLQEQPRQTLVRILQDIWINIKPSQGTPALLSQLSNSSLSNMHPHRPPYSPPLSLRLFPFRTHCEAFTCTHNSTLQVLSYIPAGTKLSFPYNDCSRARPYQFVSVSLCRVALSIPTSERSGITFELWLPEWWRGRVLRTGNGGIVGCAFSSLVFLCSLWRCKWGMAGEKTWVKFSICAVNTKKDTQH